MELDLKDLQSLQNWEWRKRLRLVCDLIFTSAMTILVLNLELPHFDANLEGEEFVKFFVRQIAGMANVIIVFIVISVYWIKHLEIFSMIPKVDQKLIWFQLFYLLFMILLPFWNTYVSMYPDNATLKAFLSLDMILVGLFSYLTWNYATNTKHRLAHPEVSNETIKTYRKQILVEPIIALFAAGLGYINPELWDLAFVAVPLAFALRTQIQKVDFYKLIRKKA